MPLYFVDRCFNTKHLESLEAVEAFNHHNGASFLPFVSWLSLSNQTTSPPLVNVIKVTTAVTYGRKVSLTAVTSVLDVIKHFYGGILCQQSHLVA